MLLVISDVDTEIAQTLRELRKVDHIVAVFVKLVQKIDSIVLKTGVVLGWSFNLFDNGAIRGLWENFAVVFHVLLSVLI